MLLVEALNRALIVFGGVMILGRNHGVLFIGAL
jgi:hypothetical protein